MVYVRLYMLPVFYAENDTSFLSALRQCLVFAKEHGGLCWRYIFISLLVTVFLVVIFSVLMSYWALLLNIPLQDVWYHFFMALIISIGLFLMALGKVVILQTIPNHQS